MANFNAILLLAASVVVMVHDTIAKVSNTTDSWTCGVFFASTQPDRPPKIKLFILPERYPVEDCSRPDVESYKTRCYNMMQDGLSDWDFKKPSRIRAGSTVGKDLCRPISKTVSKPGLELAFYFAYCNSEWMDTGLRKPEPLCCTKRLQVDC